MANRSHQKEVEETIDDFMNWQVVSLTPKLFKQAISEQKRWKLSLWDGLILAAARRAGVETIWSEDFSQEQDYAGIKVVNPLA